LQLGQTTAEADPVALPVDHRPALGGYAQHGNRLGAQLVVAVQVNVVTNASSEALAKCLEVHQISAGAEVDKKVHIRIRAGFAPGI
jgi:hypothetical protein